MAGNDTLKCYRSEDLETVSSPYVRDFLIVLYVVTTIFSLGSNGVVIIVQHYGEWRMVHMRKYLINLALADIAMSALCVPFTFTNIVFREWIFPKLLCSISSFAQLLTAFVIAYTMAIIAIERYMVLVRPLAGFYKWLQSHGHFVIICVWLFGSIYAFHFLQYTSTREFKIGNKTHYKCAYQNNWSEIDRNYWLLSNFVITYAVPALILTFAYVQIIRNLWRIQVRQNSETFKTDYEMTVLSKESNGTDGNSVEVNLELNNEEISSQNADRSALTFHLLMVLFMYVLCGGPIKLALLLAEYYQILPYCSKIETYTLIYIYIGFHWCAMANCFINPIIYNYMSMKFQRNMNYIAHASLIYISRRRSTDYTV